MTSLPLIPPAAQLSSSLPAQTDAPPRTASTLARSFSLSRLPRFSSSLSAFSFSLFAFCFSALLLTLAPSAQAATATNTNNSLTWDTTSSGWSTVTGSAWDSSNGATNIAFFTNSSDSISVDAAGVWLNALTYSNASAGSTFSIGSGTLNFRGTSPTITTATSNSLSISSAITSTNALTKAGAGTLTLSSSNSYGNTTISAGTLQVGNNNALGTGTITIGSSAATLSSDSTTSRTLANTLNINGNNATLGNSNNNGVLTFTGPIISANNQFTVNSDVIFSGNWNASGSVTKVGNAALTLSGSNSFAGGTFTLNNGTLRIGNNNALGSSTISFQASTGVTLSSDSTTSRTLTNNLRAQAAGLTMTFGNSTNNGTLNLSGAFDLLNGSAASFTIASDVNFSGNFTNTAGLTITNAAGTTPTMTLSGSNSGMTGNIILNGGTLVSSNAFALGSGAGALTVNRGTLDLGGFGYNRTGQILFQGGTVTNGTITNNTTTNYATTTMVGTSTVAANLAGTAGLNKTTASGTLILSGNNTYTGTTTLAQGTLSISSDANLSGTNSALVFTGGTLRVTGTSLNSLNTNRTTTFNVTNSSGLTFDIADANNNFTVAQTMNITNGSQFFKVGAGTLTLTGTNTLGTMNIQEGAISVGTINNNGVVGPLGNGNTTVLGSSGKTGTLSYTGGTTNSTRTYSLATGGTGAFEVTQSSTSLTNSGAISGSGTLSKTGAGNLVLATANSYSGGTVVNAGILTITGTNALPSWNTSGKYSVASGATLALFNAISEANMTNMVYGTTNFLAGSAIGFDTTSGNRTNSLVLSNTAQGALGLTKTGSGTLVLNAANTYTGTTTVSAGTIALSGGDNRLNTNGSVSVSSGATLNLGGNNQTLAGLTGSGAVTNSANTLTLNVGSGNNTFDGSIRGAGAFTKAGAGTVTLTGANTYSGATTVNGGTLRINGASAIGTNTVSLADATFLSYIGSGVATLSNNITVGSGTATIANLTNSLLTLGGTLAKNGTTLTLNGGSGGINVTGSITGSSANSDLVIGSGTVTLSGINTYNGPTFVNNGATLNADSALPTANGASDLSLDSTGSGSSKVNLGINQTIGSLSGASSSTVNLNARTLTLSKSGSGTSTYAGSITGSGGNLFKSGAFTQTLTGTNDYSGTTTVSGGKLSLGTTGSLTGTTNVTVGAGSTLLLGSSVANSINANAALNLGGGQLSMGAGSSRAASQNFTTLTLTANSSIDFSSLTGSSSLYFSNIQNLSSWTLSIYNYNDKVGDSDYTKLYAATANTGNFSSSLGNILFYSGGSGSSLIGSGSFGGIQGDFTEIVAVPEPSVVISALMLVGWLLFANRGLIRRMRVC